MLCRPTEPCFPDTFSLHHGSCSGESFTCACDGILDALNCLFTELGHSLHSDQSPLTIMNDSKSVDEYSSVLTLTLHPDNPANTTIRDESGDTVYTISTTFDAKSVPTTSVLNEQGKLVADWRWKESRLDSQMLRFEGVGIGAFDNGIVEVEEGGKWKGRAKERSAASAWLRKTLIPYKQ